MGMLGNFSKGVQCLQETYKLLEVFYQERQTPSIQLRLTPIQTYFINIAIVNKRQTFECIVSNIFIEILIKSFD